MASKHLEPELRILLWGKTGSGKSTAGNMILGKKIFETDSSSVSETGICVKREGKFGNQTVVVVDTPGLYHTDMSLEELKERLLQCTMLTKPGPHVFLLVQNGTSFSSKDKEILEAFQRGFEGAKCHTILLITHGKKYEEGRYASLDTFIKESFEEHHFFEEEDEKDQVSGLLEKINNLVQKNESRYYSNEMFDKAEDAFTEIQKQRKSESKETTLMCMERCISETLAALAKIDPAMEAVISFLKILKGVALKLMPPEALKSK